MTKKEQLNALIGKIVFVEQDREPYRASGTLSCDVDFYEVTTSAGESVCGFKSYEVSSIQGPTIYMEQSDEIHEAVIRADENDWDHPLR